MRSEDEIYKLKSIEDYEQEMYHKAHIRWEEMNIEKATTAQLIKARNTIQKELDKRLQEDNQ